MSSMVVGAVGSSRSRSDQTIADGFAYCGSDLELCACSLDLVTLTLGN